MATNRIHPLQAVTLLLVLIGLFLAQAGSAPPTRECGGEYVWENGTNQPWTPGAWTWITKTCETEPTSLNELGYDFLEVTGLAKNTANTIGFGFFVLAFFCIWLHSYVTMDDEETEESPESLSEPEAEPEEPADESSNWWED